MSSKSARAYGSLTRSDVFILDPRKVVIEEDDPSHPDYSLHEPRRKINPRMLSLIRRKGADAIGEIGVKLKKLDDGRTITVAKDGRKRLRHARIVLREKLEAMGVNPDTFEPSEGDPLPLAVRAVPRKDDASTQIFNAYSQKDPPLMVAAKVAEYEANGVPLDEIEILVNRSPSQIANYRKLWGDGCAELKTALHADKITFNFALKLCNKSHDKQREALAKLGERGKKLRGQAV